MWKIIILLFLIYQNEFCHGDIESHIKQHLEQQLSSFRQLNDNIQNELHSNLTLVQAAGVPFNSHNVFSNTYSYSGQIQNGGSPITQPLGDLGSQIRQQVDEQLAPLKYMSQNMQNEMQRNLAPLQSLGGLGDQIRQNVDQQLSPLKNLGENIRNEVNQNLAPVHALNIQSNMRNGFAGITTVSYTGEHPRNLIIQNDQRMVCHGNFRGSNCDGAVEPFTIKSKSDYCFAHSYAAYNDRVCLANTAVMVQARNNEISCEAFNGAPSLLLTRDQYSRMCGDVAHFTYYAEPNNPYAIPIPNQNPYVRCDNREPGICRFTESTSLSHISSTSSYSHSSFSYNVHP